MRNEGTCLFLGREVHTHNDGPNDDRDDTNDDRHNNSDNGDTINGNTDNQQILEICVRNLVSDADVSEISKRPR